MTCDPDPAAVLAWDVGRPTVSGSGASSGFLTRSSRWRPRSWPSWAGRSSQLIAPEVKLLKVRKLAQVAGQLLQVVSSKVKGLEAGELAKLGGQLGKAVVTETQSSEVGELAEFGGQPGQAVVADLK